ncbi:MAG: CBS domain-containing protein, partial [Pseudomonadota bacterium]
NRLVGIVTMEDVLELLAGELADLASGLAGAKDREAVERT